MERGKEPAHWEPNGIVPMSVAVSDKRGECGVGPATLEPECLDPVSLAAFYLRDVGQVKQPLLISIPLQKGSDESADFPRLR